MNPPKIINLALLGTEGIAKRALAPAIEKMEGARLWSVLSRNLGRAAAFAETRRAAAPYPAYDDLEKLVSDPELDGVVIATPDRAHRDQAIIAARAGKHVFVEKPLATSAEDGLAMVTAAREADVRLGVAYHLRWHAGHRKMRALAAAGDLGDLRHVRVHYAWLALDDLNWRAHPDMGRWWSLAGVGTHCLDLIRWFMRPVAGEVVDLASIVSKSVWKGPHDETAIVAMRFENGATAELTSSVLFASPSLLEVYGTTSHIIATGTLGPHGGGLIRTAQGDLDFVAVDPYVGELEDFVAAIREGREPEVNGEEGLRNIELLERASP